jgi:hypothetical protein
VIKDGLPVEASQEGQSRPVSLAGSCAVRGPHGGYGRLDHVAYSA